MFIENRWRISPYRRAVCRCSSCCFSGQRVGREGIVDTRLFVPVLRPLSEGNYKNHTLRSTVTVYALVLPLRNAFHLVEGLFRKASYKVHSDCTALKSPTGTGSETLTSLNARTSSTYLANRFLWNLKCSALSSNLAIGAFVHD